MGENIELWEIIRGYSCRQCCDVARADPNDGERWGCKTCDVASKELFRDFTRDADERERRLNSTVEVHLNTRDCEPMQPETAEALATMFKVVHDQFQEVTEEWLVEKFGKDRTFVLDRFLPYLRIEFYVHSSPSLIYERGNRSDYDYQYEEWNLRPCRYRNEVLKLIEAIKFVFMIEG